MLSAPQSDCRSCAINYARGSSHRLSLPTFSIAHCHDSTSCPTARRSATATTTPPTCSAAATGSPSSTGATLPAATRPPTLHACGCCSRLAHCLTTPQRPRERLPTLAGASSSPGISAPTGANPFGHPRAQAMDTRCSGRTPRRGYSGRTRHSPRPSTRMSVDPDAVAPFTFLAVFAARPLPLCCPENGPPQEVGMSITRLPPA
jgi:hypothetical protein